MKQPKISVRGMNLYYDDFHALKEISFDVEENEITALIGPSGCGKSSFLRSINRMNDLNDEAKVTGDIRIDGVDIYNKIDIIDLRKNVGMVFQKPNPFPMSIYKNVTYGPRSHGIKDKKVLDEIVERSLRDAALWDEVKDRLHKNAIGLSGGQQQRLCIARALAVEPKILLMDEPTSALDPIATAKIEKLINTLSEKYTVIVVTHSMQQAERISDKTAFFYMGNLIEHGPTNKMFSSPEFQRTEDYINGKFG